MKSVGRRLIGFLPPLTLAIGWQVSVSCGLLNLQYLPAPAAIARSFIAEVISGTLLADVGHTLGVAVAATALASAAGGALGTALGLLPALRTHLTASVDFLRTVPAIALMPVGLLILGPRAVTELALASYAATWPIVLTIAAAVAAVPTRLRDVARVLRLSPATTIRTVILPAALLGWLAGARTSAIIALHVTVIVEMIIAPVGLGGGLIGSLNALDPARMWAYVVTCGALGSALQGPLRRAARTWASRQPGQPAIGQVVDRAGGAPVRGLWPLMALIAGWEMLAGPDVRALPPPTQWVAAVAELHSHNRLVPALSDTLATAALAMAGATLVGASLGVALGTSPRLERIMAPTLNFLASIPGSAIVPLAILLLGTGRLTSTAVVGLAIVWPILLTTAVGVSTIPVVRLEMSRTLGLSRGTRWRAVVLPSVLPAVLLGGRVSASLALIVTLLVDIIGTGDGMGRLLAEAQQRFDAAAAWGLVAIVGVIGYLASLVVGQLERRLLRHWPPTVAGSRSPARTR